MRVLDQVKGAEVNHKIAEAIDACASEHSQCDCDFCSVRERCVSYWDNFIAKTGDNNNSEKHIRRIQRLQKLKKGGRQITKT